MRFVRTCAAGTASVASRTSVTASLGGILLLIAPSRDVHMVHPGAARCAKHVPMWSARACELKNTDQRSCSRGLSRRSDEDGRH